MFAMETRFGCKTIKWLDSIKMFFPSLNLLYASLTFLYGTVRSITSNEYPVWGGHRKEAKRGSLYRPRLKRDYEAMVSVLLPCATTWLSLRCWVGLDWCNPAGPGRDACLAN